MDFYTLSYQSNSKIGPDTQVFSGPGLEIFNGQAQLLLAKFSKPPVQPLFLNPRVFPLVHSWVG